MSHFNLSIRATEFDIPLKLTAEPAEFISELKSRIHTLHPRYPTDAIHLVKDGHEMVNNRLICEYGDDDDKINLTMIIRPVQVAADDDESSESDLTSMDVDE